MNREIFGAFNPDNQPSELIKPEETEVELDEQDIPPPESIRFRIGLTTR